MLAADAFNEQIDCGHGRVESWRCSVLVDLSLLDQVSALPSLQAIVRFWREPRLGVDGLRSMRQSGR